jgi:hypothetical protein
MENDYIESRIDTEITKFSNIDDDSIVIQRFYWLKRIYRQIKGDIMLIGKQVKMHHCQLDFYDENGVIFFQISPQTETQVIVIFNGKRKIIDTVDLISIIKSDLSKIT